MRRLEARLQVRPRGQEPSPQSSSDSSRLIPVRSSASMLDLPYRCSARSGSACASMLGTSVLLLAVGCRPRGLAACRAVTVLRRGGSDSGVCADGQRGGRPLARARCWEADRPVRDRSPVGDQDGEAVGYGDTYPVTTAGKILAVLVISPTIGVLVSRARRCLER